LQKCKMQNEDEDSHMVTGWGMKSYLSHVVQNIKHEVLVGLAYFIPTYHP